MKKAFAACLAVSLGLLLMGCEPIHRNTGQDKSIVGNSIKKTETFQFGTYINCIDQNVSCLKNKKGWGTPYLYLRNDYTGEVKLASSNPNANGREWDQIKWRQQGGQVIVIYTVTNEYTERKAGDQDVYTMLSPFVIISPKGYYFIQANAAGEDW